MYFVLFKSLFFLFLIVVIAEEEKLSLQKTSEIELHRFNQFKFKGKFNYFINKLFVHRWA